MIEISARALELLLHAAQEVLEDWPPRAQDELAEAIRDARERLEKAGMPQD